MTFDERSLEHAPTATSPIWLAPVAMLIAWLAALLNLIARMKKVRYTTRFKPDWRDHWDGLRRSEWQRDQMLAQGAALLLSGKTLDDADCVLIPEPPADYGGLCPRTPFQMNRRFLALAEFMKDPETAIRRHAARIAKRGSALAAHGSTDAALCAAAHHEAVGVALSLKAQIALMVSSTRSVRPSNHEGVRANARGPPTAPLDCRLPTADCLSRPTAEVAPACAPSRTGLSTAPMTTSAHLLRLKWQAAKRLAPARR